MAVGLAKRAEYVREVKEYIVVTVGTNDTYHLCIADARNLRDDLDRALLAYQETR